MNYDWKILEIQADDGLITAAKYHITATEKDLSVQTEGYWRFFGKTATVKFADVTENMVIDWIEKETSQDGKCAIKARLAEQLESLKNEQKTSLPWMPQTFTPNL